ncbi:Utp14-domain-containing protein [Schizopora paradoxa]|uniref:Utp14-domain-containing protein n=1 Tax=Schizopora paradoxa TaxID=27342 RepID=A0A0H2SEF3_9AGAM|nr:Utp14-domain-containing protein [Schizopora paradoxa]
MAVPKLKKSANRGKGKGKAKHPQLPASLLATERPNSAKKRSNPRLAFGAEDPYEYDERETVLKRGRSNVKLTLDKEEVQTGAYSSDDDDGEETGAGSSSRMPKLYGAGDDEDEEFISEDDEDIDSDEAFEESDVDRFAGFTFRPSKDEVSDHAGPSRPRHMEEESSESENSEDEEEEEGEDGDFIDVLDMMDGRAQSRADQADDDSDGQEEEDFAGGEEGVDDDESEEDGGESEEEEKGVDEDEDMISGEEDEGVDLLSALDNLDKFVSKLSTSKRKADEEETEDAPVKDSKPKKKARFVQDVTEAGTAEGEFGARPSGSSKLTLDDLIVPLSTQANPSVDSLKKAIKPLGSSSSKNQPLSAPLPTRTQEKIDREAAYEQTKKEADKWNETMKQIKEAEHLSFPLQAQREGKPSNLELAAKFKPTTELENAVDKLLKSAKLREEDIAKTEELMMNNLSVEEVAERRNQLRKMRDLMFRADMKAKRVSKIKSKTYRRIRKKEKEKLMAKLGTEGGDEEDDEEARLKHEVERARERATLKHKNTGKWARAMKSRGELDEDQRRDINEMLEKGEQLRKRIAGVASDEEDGDDEADGDGEGGSTSLSRVKAAAFDELDRLRDDGSQDGLDVDGKPRKAKSVFEMKFMKDAAARQNQEVDREIDDFRREIGDLTDHDDEHSIVPPDNGEPAPSISVERLGGRMTFKPGPQFQSTSLQNPTSMPPPPPSNAALSRSTTITEGPNPWLQLGEGSSSKLSRKKNEVVMGRDVSLAQKSDARIKSALSKSAEGRAQAADDATVEIDETNALTISQTAVNDSSDARKQKKEKRKNKKLKSKSNASAGEALLKGGKALKAFDQRDLVSRAFAGDNVVREFEELKRKEIEMDAPREEDTTLPGWGSWGGVGTKKAPPKPHLIKKIAGIDPKSRTDYNKANVIISEKRDKKAAKYTVKDLPYPYTSKAQFEQSMDTPLGAEWNTRIGFQRGTLPKVVKKMGTVINPLEKQF